ncbi:unnamed protein product [Closterium sp. NIES-54]
MLSSQQLRKRAVRRGGSGGGQQQQQRPPETLSPQQLREWAVRWGNPSGGAWGTSAGGGEALGVEPEEALHTFTLDPGASRCFLSDSTTVTPLTVPVPVTLADPSGGTSPTLRWTGEVGDVSEFRVWGSLSLVRNLPAGKLSPHTLRCVLLGFPIDAPPWHFYYLGSRRVLSSRDVTFDESVCFYHLHPHRSSSIPLLPLSLVDPPPLVELLEVSSDTSSPAEGGDPSAADTVAPRRSACLAVPPGFPPRPSSLPLQPVGVDSGAAGGGDTRGAATVGTAVGGAGGAGAGGTGARRQETLSPERLREWAVRWGSLGGGTERAGAGGTGRTVPGVGHAGGTGAGGTGATGGTRGTGVVGAVAGGTGSRRQEPLLPEQLREWAVRWGSPSGGAGRTRARGAGGTGYGGASAGVSGVGGTRGADTGGTTGGTRVGGASRQESLSPKQLFSGGAVTTRARDSGGATTQPQPSALSHLLSLPPAATEFPVAGTTHLLLFPLPDRSQPQLPPHSLCLLLLLTLR